MKRKDASLVIRIVFLFVILFSFASCSRGGDSKSSSIYTDSIQILPSGPLSVSEGYGEINKNGYTFGFSNLLDTPDAKIKLKKGGIVFNKTPISSIVSMRIVFEENGFTGASLFYGSNVLPYINSQTLSSSSFVNIPKGNSFFVIRSSDENEIKELTIDYSFSSSSMDSSLPCVFIETEKDEFGKHKPIVSKEEYVNCEFNINDDNDHENDLTASAGIRIRGNSTAGKPKKPYRIKFAKKQSLFGLEKGKNWCLLADYLDGSAMHNYSALAFSKMVRGEEFTPTPIHVNVFLNGEDIGLYLLTENPDEKEGRLDIEVDDSYILSLFDDNNDFDFTSMPLLIERDARAFDDPKEVENETYFKVMQKNGDIFAYSLKYPSKENFYSCESGEAIFHSEKFVSFVSKLKTRMTSLHDSFNDLAKGFEGSFEKIESLVDIDSLASYALVDYFALESDHQLTSLKIYKSIGTELLSFGPVWDYDTCAFGFPFREEPIEDPHYFFDSCSSRWIIADCFGKAFYYSKQGKAILSSLWNSLSLEQIKNYLSGITMETSVISRYLVQDTSLWHGNRHFVTFDNLRYIYNWLIHRIDYLSSDFSQSSNS